MFPETAALAAGDGAVGDSCAMVAPAPSAITAALARIAAFTCHSPF
jgi:hypothetical protein